MKKLLGIACIALMGCGLTAAQIEQDVVLVANDACTISSQVPSDPSFVIMICNIVDSTGKVIGTQKIQIPSVQANTLRLKLAK
jgi:hypothetical protein